MRTPSESELASKASFDDFLQQHLPGVPRTWHVAEEPLDFRLEFGPDEFIVEVTQLRLHLKFGGLQLPHSIVRDHFDAFIHEVEAAALDTGVLFGTYVACFPRPIAHFSSVKSDLKADLLNLIEEMELQPSGAENVFLRHARRRFTLRKIDTAGASVLMSGPYDSRWEGEARSELYEMLRDRIDVKATRTQGRSLPTILLLDEQNLFATGSMYTHCQPVDQAATSFHSIYVRRPGATGILLRSGFSTLHGIWDVREGQPSE